MIIKQLTGYRTAAHYAGSSYYSTVPVDKISEAIDKTLKNGGISAQQVETIALEPKYKSISKETTE